MRHMIDIIFVLSLFCVFTVSSAVILLFGADIYKNTAYSMDFSFSSRTSAAYVTEKVRQSDTYDSICIDESKGYERLVMTREIDGVTYATSLYEHDGFLCELFAREDIALPADAGQQVIALTGLDFELVSDSLLAVRFVDEAKRDTEIYINLHCGAKQPDMGGNSRWY